MNVVRLRPRGAGGFRRGDRDVTGMLALGAALLLLLLLTLGTGARATPGSPVVPPTGKVAGHGYAYWMKRHWQFAFSLSASASRSPNPCHTLTANGRRVAWLSGPYTTGSHACSEPAGRPIYVNLVSIECSTFKGDHDDGTSDASLQQCSKTHFAEAGRPSATVDGHAVDVNTLVTGTGAFPVHAAAGNPVGVPAGSGRSAAYGIGLLLTGFSKGAHTIHCVVHGGGNENLAWIVRVA